MRLVKIPLNKIDGVIVYPDPSVFTEQPDLVQTDADTGAELARIKRPPKLTDKKWGRSQIQGNQLVGEYFGDDATIPDSDLPWIDDPAPAGPTIAERIAALQTDLDALKAALLDR